MVTNILNFLQMKLLSTEVQIVQASKSFISLHISVIGIEHLLHPHTQSITYIWLMSFLLNWTTMMELCF